MSISTGETAVATGENICIDGGMTRLMIYHDEHRWQYQQ